MKRLCYFLEPALQSSCFDLAVPTMRKSTDLTKQLVSGRFWHTLSVSVCLVVYSLTISPVFAQQPATGSGDLDRAPDIASTVYALEAGSAGHRIELELTGDESGNASRPLVVRVEAAPEWVLFATSEVNAESGEGTGFPVAVLDFDVAFGAPADDPAEVRLGVWQKAQNGRGDGADEQRVGETTIQLVVEAPRDVTLEGNYPNPFGATTGGQTTIRYALPQPSEVRLVVYDMLGREVARLVDGEQAAGGQEVVWEALGLASGMYVARLTVDGVSGRTVRHQRMVFVK